jgi:hypothetical protein
MGTVTIGCKLPNGIWMIQDAARVRINGWNNNTIQGGSHGITENVPDDLWDAWKKEHAESALVKGEFIFAATTVAKAVAKAADQADNKSGQEQLPQVKASDKAGELGASDA